MIVVDASLLIAHLSDRDAFHAQAVECLLATAESRLGASTITIAEVLVTPARAGRLQRATDALDDLGLEEVSLGRDAAPRLAALRAQTGLRLPDCCVLLAVGDTGADGLITFDERLASAANRLGHTLR